MNIVNYNSSFEKQFKDFLKEIAIGEFNHTNWKDYIENKDMSPYEKEDSFLIMEMENDEIIGTCAILKVDKKTVKLNSFYIKKEYRSRKLGTFLYNMLLRIAKEEGYKRIILCTYDEYKYAKNFYDKNGFSIYKKENNGEIWMEKWI